MIGKNKNKRKESDFYETPEWCVDAITPKIMHHMLCVEKMGRFDHHLPTNRTFMSTAHIVDPGSGTGNIAIRLYRNMMKDTFAIGPVFHCIEIDTVIRHKMIERLQGEFGSLDDFTVIDDDFLKFNDYDKYNYCVGNPPYSLAQEFVTKALEIADNVIFLLRIDFLGSLKRGKLYREKWGEPDIYVLERRPSFTGDGQTDSNNYTWFWWPKERRVVNKYEPGKIHHLECP